MRRALLALALLLPLGLASAPAQANPYDDYKALNDAEKRLALRYFWQLLDVKDAAEQARAASTAAFPQWVGQDDPRDAFRHALWNGLMTSKLGSVDAAERWGTAHEQLPGNPPVRQAMDLSNNDSGRSRVWAARTTRSTWWGGRKNVLPDDAAVQTIIRDALRTGGLVEIEEVAGVRDPNAGRLVPTFVP